MRFILLCSIILLVGAGCMPTAFESREREVAVPAETMPIPPLSEIEAQANVTPVEDMIDMPSRAQDREDLIGSWEIIEGDAQEITLESDGTYSTFLHGRPFDDGEWEFVDGQLILESSALGVKIFEDVVFEEGMLILEGDDGLYEVWGEIN